MTKTYTGTVTVSIDHQQLIDHIEGSGAIMYSWWHDVEIDEGEGTVTVVIDDPDYDEGSGHTITATKTLAEVADHMLANYTVRRGLDIRDGIIDLDMDANDMDSVLQWVAFGKDIYA